MAVDEDEDEDATRSMDATCKGTGKPCLPSSSVLVLAKLKLLAQLVMSDISSRRSNFTEGELRDAHSRLAGMH